MTIEKLKVLVLNFTFLTKVTFFILLLLSISVWYCKRIDSREVYEWYIGYFEKWCLAWFRYYIVYLLYTLFIGINPLPASLEAYIACIVEHAKWSFCIFTILSFLVIVVFGLRILFDELLQKWR